MRLHFIGILALASVLPACELVASFDREKIPLPALVRPDASFTPRPADPELDSGSGDAAVADASLPEAGAQPEGGMDASVSMDASLHDAAVPHDASIPVDAGLDDGGLRDN